MAVLARCIDGDEVDAFTAWRKRCIWRAGDIRKIKRRFNKRVRAKGRREAKWPQT